MTDLLVYFPLSHWKVKADGFKLQTTGSRIAHDALIVGLLHKFGVRFLDVFDGTPEERALQIVTQARLTMSAKERVKSVAPKELVLG